MTITAGSASVKIYRVNHATAKTGKAFVLAWTTPMGRKMQKFASPKDAIREAKIKAGQLAHGRVEGADMTRGDRDELQAARQAANGTPVLAIIAEWTKARALTAGNILPACEAWAARAGKVHKRVKVADVVKEFLKAKKAVGRELANNQSTYDRINLDFGAEFIDAITSRQIEAWLAHWIHPTTRNTYRRRLATIWKWSQGRGFLPPDVRNEAEKTDTAHEEAPKIGIINVATWEKLLAYFHGAHPELLPALVLAGFGGLRRKEVHAQTWDDVSLERNSVRVTDAKRGTPARRLVPLCPAAVAWLLLCKNRKGPVCPLVEVDGKMQPALAVDGIRRIARKAKLELPANALRHSFISHACAATGDIPRVSLNAGNSPKEVNRHYRELVSEHEGKAWFAVAPGKVGEVIAMGGAAS